MSLPTYLMSNFPSVRPSLNLQFDSQPTPEDMTSHLASVGATFSRASIGTYTDANGIIQEATSGQARPNYSTAGVHEGLLIEESRTNEFAYSEDFTTTWSNSNGTISSNQISAPDGNTTADELEATATSSVSYAFQLVSFAVEDYTISVYAKESSSSVLWLYVRSGAEQGIAYFDLSDQTTQAVAGSSTTPTNLTIEDVGNGWYRCSATFDNTTATTSGTGVGVSDAKGNDSVTAGKSVYIWGAQLEEQSQVTSYIPTTTASATRSADVYSTATKQRSADVCYIDGTAFTDFYNQEEGTFLIDFDTGNYGVTQNFVSINDGTTNNRYVWYFSSSGFLNFRKVVSGSNNQVNGGSSITTFLPDIKMVAYYNLLGAGFLIEGTDGDSLSETTQLNLNKLQIGSDAKWTIKKFIYFPRKLSTAEFEKLTQ